MKLAIMYARYSSERQTEQSIEGQLDVCKKYAEQNGLQIVDTYIDRAMTGTNDNRAAFQQMLSDSDKAPWEIVLVYALDRFGRNSIEMALNKKKLIDNKKILISATQKTSTNIDGTKNLDGIMLENIYTGVAEYYSAELSQKIRRGQNESRKKGQFCGGGLPDGYSVDKDKHIQINEERAIIIKYIYEQYSIGVVVPKIMEQLNEKGIVNADGKPFTKNGMYNILKNEKYSGTYKINGETYDNIYPRIVPQEIFEKVHKIRGKNSSGKRSVKQVYLLRFKVKCGYCGSSISAQGGKSHSGKMVYYYGCIGRKKQETKCKKIAIRKEILEKLVLDSLKKKLTSKETMAKIVHRLMQVQKELTAANPMLNILLKEKQKTDTALDNLVTALENGISSSTTNKRLHELEERREDLKRSILIEQSKTIVLLTEEEIREFYKQALELEPKLLINTLVKQITLYDDKMIIELNSPLNISPDENRGFSFYDEIIKMPKVIQNIANYVYTDLELIMKV